MVKNNGGNKAKKFASKSFNISDRATRYAIETDEIYAIVTKMLEALIVRYYVLMERLDNA